MWIRSLGGCQTCGDEASPFLANFSHYSRGGSGASLKRGKPQSAPSAESLNRSEADRSIDAGLALGTPQALQKFDGWGAFCIYIMCQEVVELSAESNWIAQACLDRLARGCPLATGPATEQQTFSRTSSCMSCCMFVRIVCDIPG